MHRLLRSFFLVSFFTLAACAGVNESNQNNPPSPYAGDYVGTEILEGGTYPLKIKVSSSGKVRVVDIDGIVARGEMNGNQFIARRASPRQVFEGTIVDGKIEGVTTENPFLGDGTFSAELRQ